MKKWKVWLLTVLIKFTLSFFYTITLYSIDIHSINPYAILPLLSGTVPATTLSFFIALGMKSFIVKTFKQKEDNLKNIEEKNDEYECIHCGFVDDKEFDYCPHCDKDDNGLTIGDKKNI